LLAFCSTFAIVRAALEFLMFATANPSGGGFDVSGRVFGLMENSKGRDNAKKRATRRKKTERLALAKRKKAAK
jgi:hypothetical protein